MVLSGAQHNFANMYDPIKNKLASVNKILCSLRYWGVMLLVYKSTIPAISASPSYCYGATRAHVSVCFMLHSDCAAYVHLRCSHGHGAGAEFRSKQYADEAESAKITSSSATFP